MGITVVVDEAFCNSFVQALTAMTSLSKLDIDLGNDEDVCSKLRVSFKDSQPRLHIRTLTLSHAPNAPFILLACPALHTFIACGLHNKWKRTFAALPSMTALRQLEIDRPENWTEKRLKGERVLGYQPN